MAVYWNPRLEKRGTIEFGKPICNPWGGPMVPAFINIMTSMF